MNIALNKESPVLLITFRRADNTEKLIKKLLECNIENIFIYHNGPINLNDENECLKTKNVILNYASKNQNIKTLFKAKNTKISNIRTTISGLQNIQNYCRENNLDIEISGIPAISIFNFKSKNSKKYITFITQEMLKKGYLANNMVYVSVEHSEKVLRRYFNILDECFVKISLCESKKLSIKKLLITEVFKESFTRLN